jgi:uroporphyrinogen-III synthase
LNARQVRIDMRAASPFTTDSVLEAVSPIELSAARVLVQRYGAENQYLREALETRGASVREIATYRWGLPADTRPLHELLDALASARLDAVVFTSAVQIHNLFIVAGQAGRAANLAGQLNRLCIASIGPVCSRALREHGIEPSFEADPPKLGPLVAGLDAALGASVQR